MKTLCVSLETAKALKAAGWTKPTEFAYEYVSGQHMLRGGAFKISLTDFPSPTAEEVLRELPEEISMLRFSLGIYKYGKAWSVQYDNDDFDSFENESLSEAAAQMWLWCVKEGYIKVVKP